MVTRLFLLGAAILASACSFHTHEAAVAHPAQQPVYVAAPRDAVVVNHPGKRRPGRARPGRAHPDGPPRGPVARPNPKPPGGIAARPPRPAKPPKGAHPGPSLQPKPAVDRKPRSPQREVVCKREPEKNRKHCTPKRRQRSLAQSRDG